MSEARTADRMGLAAPWGAAIACALVAAGLALGWSRGEAQRTFGALVASWLFFAGAAAGAVSFNALFRITGGKWTRPLRALALGQTAFLPVALLGLLVILAGAFRAPWVAAPEGWMSPALLIPRELALTGLLFAVAFFGFRAREDTVPPPKRTVAVLYLLLFAVVLSSWAVDFILGADPIWSSTLIGTYLFVCAFISGAAISTLRGLKRGVFSPQEQRDAGAFHFAMSIFWAYLFWSQYLTLWYGNLPDEIVFAQRRVADGWGSVMTVMIGFVFVVPFLLLIHAAGRRSPKVLRVALLLQLIGLWASAYLLVVPSLAPAGSGPLAPQDVLMALGLLGAYLLAEARMKPVASAAI